MSYFYRITSLHGPNNVLHTEQTLFSFLFKESEVTLLLFKQAGFQHLFIESLSLGFCLLESNMAVYIRSAQLVSVLLLIRCFFMALYASI